MNELDPSKVGFDKWGIHPVGTEPNLAHLDLLFTKSRALAYIEEIYKVVVKNPDDTVNIGFELPNFFRFYNGGPGALPLMVVDHAGKHEQNSLAKPLAHSYDAPFIALLQAVPANNLDKFRAEEIRVKFKHKGGLGYRIRLAYQALVGKVVEIETGILALKLQ